MTTEYAKLSDSELYDLLMANLITGREIYFEFNRRKHARKSDQKARMSR